MAAYMGRRLVGTAVFVFCGIVLLGSGYSFRGSPLAGSNHAFQTVEIPGDNVHYLQTPPAGVNISKLSRFCFAVKPCDKVSVILSELKSWERSCNILFFTNGAVIIDIYGNFDHPVSEDGFQGFYVSWSGDGTRLFMVANGSASGGDGNSSSGAVSEKPFVENPKCDSPVNFIFASSAMNTSTWRMDFECQMLSTDSSATAVATTAGDAANGTSSEGHAQPTTSSSSTSFTATSETEASTAATPPVTNITSNTATTRTTPASPPSTTTNNNDNTIISTVNRPCQCRCVFSIPHSGALANHSSSLDRGNAFSELAVDGRATSAFRRKKTSAEDGRRSSAGIGLVAAVCAFTPFLLIALSDLLTALRYVVARRKDRRDTGQGTVEEPN